MCIIILFIVNNQKEKNYLTYKSFYNYKSNYIVINVVILILF